MSARRPDSDPKRNVLITGAGGGIGSAIGRAFLANGDHVTLADLDLAAWEESGDPRVHLINVDLATPGAARAMVRRSYEARGHLDVLVNAAALLVIGTVRDIDEDQFARSFAINVTASAMASAEAIEIFMSQARPGCIVNIASTAATTGGSRIAAYGATKGALLTLTKCMALDYAADGIRINAVCPGSTRTGMTQTYLKGLEDPDEAYRDLLSALPFHRQADPDEIAGAVVFLASDQASYITGSTIVVDGGFSLG